MGITRLGLVVFVVINNFITSNKEKPYGEASLFVFSRGLLNHTYFHIDSRNKMSGNPYSTGAGYPTAYQWYSWESSNEFLRSSLRREYYGVLG